MKVTVLEERTVWNYFSIILSCLRFDPRNLSVEQKSNIAKKMNPLIADFRGKEAPNGEDESGRAEIKEVKRLFKAILSLFLEARPERWPKDNVTDIFEQLACSMPTCAPTSTPFCNASSSTYLLPWSRSSTYCNANVSRKL